MAVIDEDLSDAQPVGRLDEAGVFEASLRVRPVLIERRRAVQLPVGWNVRTFERSGTGD